MGKSLSTIVRLIINGAASDPDDDDKIHLRAEANRNYYYLYTNRRALVWLNTYYKWWYSISYLFVGI